MDNDFIDVSYRASVIEEIKTNDKAKIIQYISV